MNCSKQNDYAGFRFGLSSTIYDEKNCVGRLLSNQRSGLFNPKSIPKLVRRMFRIKETGVNLGTALEWMERSVDLQQQNNNATAIDDDNDDPMPFVCQTGMHTPTNLTPIKRKYGGYVEETTGNSQYTLHIYI